MSEPEKKIEFASFGQLRKLEREREAEERRQREERARAAAAPAPEPSPIVPQPIRHEPAHGQPAQSEPARADQTILYSETTPRTERPHQKRIRQGTTRRERAGEEPADDGYWQLPNWVSDKFLPQLGPYEQLVMFRIFRLTLGWKRDTCVVSQEKLAEKTQLSKATVIRVTKLLKNRGYIATETLEGGVVGGRALRYRLLAPAIPPGGIRQETIRSERTRQAAPRREPTGPEPSMTVLEKHEEQPVYQVRVIAARLFEAHRGEAGFDHERLRELVTEVLIGQGRPHDSEMIEDAIRGMAN